MKEKRKDLIKNQLELYKEKYSEFVQFNEILEKILNRMAKHVSNEYIIQARVKTLTSFAEKSLRLTILKDPITEMTDICGLRIIFSSRNEVERVSSIIEKNFVLDPTLSRSKEKDLAISEFGYSTDHYSIKLKKNSPIYNDMTCP